MLFCEENFIDNEILVTCKFENLVQANIKI